MVAPTAAGKTLALTRMGLAPVGLSPCNPRLATSQLATSAQMQLGVAPTAYAGLPPETENEA